MQIKSAQDLGALIRSRRRATHLSQSQLAAQMDVSQRWVSGMENGKPTAEIGLVLRALTVLGIHLDAMPTLPGREADAPRSPIDIDKIVADAAQPRGLKP